MTREHLRPVVHEARRCDELALTRDAPGSEGRLDIAFTIGRDGAVPEAMVRSADPRLSPALRECVLAAVRKMKTLAPDGGPVRVTWPFRFAPR